jgi:hypothetical protein
MRITQNDSDFSDELGTLQTSGHEVLVRCQTCFWGSGIRQNSSDVGNSGEFHYGPIPKYFIDETLAAILRQILWPFSCRV